MTTIKSVDAKDAKEWLDNGDAVIVDVREPGEHQEIRIAEATLIPLGAIDLDKLPELNGKKLVIHCKMGKRGGKACEILQEKNPELDIYNLEGGILAWLDAGFKVEKS